MESIEMRQNQQEGEIKGANSRIDETNQNVARLESRIEQEKSGTSVLLELRERKARRLNVVLYGIGESSAESVEERRNWDRQSCVNIFKALKLNLNNSCIKFVRRIGEKGARPRPLVAGMMKEADKNLLLDSASGLKDTVFKNVGISPDLTPGELQEERELAQEAEKRNRELTAEDRAKNLKWLVVGPKGEKRLIKGVERVTVARASLPPPPPTVTTPPPAAALGNQPRPRANSKRMFSEGESDEENPSQATQTQKRQHRQPTTPETGWGGTQAVDDAPTAPSGSQD